MKYGTKAIKQAKLELWPNPNPERDYVIDISYPEFTCLCPRSGYPDFATIRITYTPDKKVVELKALKLWLNSFRDQSISHEAVTNLIFSTLEKQLKPRDARGRRRLQCARQREDRDPGEALRSLVGSSRKTELSPCARSAVRSM